MHRKNAPFSTPALERPVPALRLDGLARARCARASAAAALKAVSRTSPSRASPAKSRITASAKTAYLKTSHAKRRQRASRSAATRAPRTRARSRPRRPRSAGPRPPSRFGRKGERCPRALPRRARTRSRGLPLGQLRAPAVVERMPRLVRGKGAERPAEQVADRVEQLVADEFVGEAQALAVQHAVLVEHHGVVEASARPLSLRSSTSCMKPNVRARAISLSTRSRRSPG